MFFPSYDGSRSSHLMMHKGCVTKTFSVLFFFLVPVISRDIPFPCPWYQKYFTCLVVILCLYSIYYATSIQKYVCLVQVHVWLWLFRIWKIYLFIFIIMAVSLPKNAKRPNLQCAIHKFPLKWPVLFLKPIGIIWFRMAVISTNIIGRVHVYNLCLPIFPTFITTL